MTLQKDVEALRNIALFRKIEPAKLKLLAFTSEHLEFMPGETLFHQGDVGDAAYILLEGDADVMVETPNGALKVATLHQNDIVGEIAILCDVPRTATIRASGDLDVLKITKDRFIRLLSDFPAVSIGVMRVLADRLARTTQELYSAQAELAAKG